MAQIDREVGNQSGLGEAVNSYNHSLTFGKKKKKILDLFTHCNNHSNVLGGERRGGQVEGGQMERYNKEEPEHGVVRWTLENALTHCSDNNIFSARA